jgi:putative spermidine/putrescine transport system ATP-binding protein
MGVAVRVAGLCRRFGSAPDAPGVGPLELHVAAGETFAVLGRSGCGKSTLVRLLAGLDDPDAGTISLDGRDATRLDPVARGVAVAFDDAPLHPHLDVEANLRVGLGAIGLPARDREASLDAAIAAFGLGGLLARRADTLSAGERRRVALARAVARRPRLLLLDEPLGNLDGPARLSLREALRAALRDLGATTFLVTHDHEVATGLASRIGFLEGGRLVQVGTAEELWRSPAHLAVATGFGPEPMIAIPDGTGTLAFRPSAARIGEPAGDTVRHFPLRAVETEFGGDLSRHRITLADASGTVLLLPATGDAVHRTLLVPIEAIRRFGPDGRRLGPPVC